MPMKNPPHPGRIVRQGCLELLGLTVTGGAEALDVTRQALNNLVNGKSGISPEMASWLSQAFGSTPELWQMNHDLARVREHNDARRAVFARLGMILLGMCFPFRRLT